MSDENLLDRTMPPEADDIPMPPEIKASARMPEDVAEMVKRLSIAQLSLLAKVAENRKAYLCSVAGGNEARATPGRRGKISNEEWAEIRAFEKKIELAEHKPTIYTYRRCSHRDSAESGLGLDAQEKTINAYVALLQAKNQDLQVGQAYSDEIVSAYSKNFLQRRNAARLSSFLQKGDHVVFARIDRAFRNAKDGLHMVDLWNEKGVTIHFASECIDLSTAHGRLLFTMLEAGAEWQSRYLSERAKECSGSRKAKCGFKKYGFKWIGEGAARMLVPDMEQRRFAQWVIDRHGCSHHSYARISDEAERIEAAKQNRAYREVNKRRKDIRPERLQTLAAAELALQREEAEAKTSAEKAAIMAEFSHQRKPQ